MKAKNISKDSCKFMQLVKQFYSDQQGVYMIMTGLLSFILLGVIALAVDGSGILLDKARLQYGTEQAALALVAENNNYRVNKEHADVARQNVSAEEIKQAGNDVTTAKQEKRNQEIIQGFVKNYLRTPYNNTDNRIDSSAAVTLEKPEKGFEYECHPVEVKNARGGVEKMATCGVTAVVLRRSWLYLKDNGGLSFDKRVKIDSGLTYATKRKDKPVPVDVMLVADFSGSMYNNSAGKSLCVNQRRDCSNRDSRSKIQTLRNVINELSNSLIPDKLIGNISPYNRFGVVSFGLGAQMNSGPIGYCYLPYLSSSKHTTEITVNIFNDTNWKKKYAKKSEYINSNTDYPRADRTVVSVSGVKIISNSNPMIIRGPKYAVIRALLSSEVNSLTGGANIVPTKQYVVRQPDGKMHTPIGYAFSTFFDKTATINSIDSFNGNDSDIYYPLYFPKNGNCLGQGEFDNDISVGNSNIRSTNMWYKLGERNNLMAFLNAVKPEGNTLASSGMLIGANMLMNKNPDPNAQPEKLESNTQRILLVLSDGNDTVLPHVTQELQEAGMCSRIRKRLDTLQVEPSSKAFKVLPSRIAFVRFGTQEEMPTGAKKAWIDCVGAQNFYEAKDGAALLEAFKKIVAVEEEVGTISNKKPQ